MMINKYNVILGFVLIVSGCSSIDSFNYNDGVQTTDKKSKPDVVEVFACSDNCPGPREKYLVKAYKGINNRFECDQVGGIPYEYIGWGKHFVCKVK